MVASIIDASFRAVFDKVFQQGQRFEDNSPRRRTLSLHGFPHETGDYVEAFSVKGVTGNLIHQGTRRTPVFVRQDFINTRFDIGLWLSLVVAAVMKKRELNKAQKSENY
jgi:hypothetical protein